MPRSIWLVLSVLVLAGCVVKPPAPSDTECGNGINAIFLKIRYYPSSGANDSVRDDSVDRSGDLFLVQGARHDGSGAVTTDSAKLYGIESSDVQKEMLRAGFYQKTQDVDVNLSWRARMTSSDFDTLCHDSASFFSLKSEYKDAQATGCTWTDITVSSQRGDHETRVCGPEPGAFATLHGDVKKIRDGLRAKVGAPA